MPPTASGDGILAELAALSEDERRVLVLASYTQLPLVEIAAVLGRDVTDVIAQLRAATDRCRAMPRSTDGGGWPPNWRPPRRRRLQRRDSQPMPPEPRGPGVPCSATAGSSASRWPPRFRTWPDFAVRQAVPLLSPVASSGPQQAPVGLEFCEPTERPPCDTTEPRCRAEIVSGLAERDGQDVISSYLDPDGDYFTGYSYSYTEDYQGSGFWRRRRRGARARSVPDDGRGHGGLPADRDQPVVRHPLRSRSTKRPVPHLALHGRQPLHPDRSEHTEPGTGGDTARRHLRDHHRGPQHLTGQPGAAGDAGGHGRSRRRPRLRLPPH